MRKVSVKFWHQEAKKWIIAEGIFHQWGSACEVYHEVPGNFSVGIVELPDGWIVLPKADDVRFLDEAPSPEGRRHA